MGPPFELQRALLLVERYFVETVPIMWDFSECGSCYFLEWARKRLRGDRQFCKGTAVNLELNWTPWEHWEPKTSSVCCSTWGEALPSSLHVASQRELVQRWVCSSSGSSLWENARTKLLPMGRFKKIPICAPYSNLVKKMSWTVKRKRTRGSLSFFLLSHLWGWFTLPKFLAISLSDQQLYLVFLTQKLLKTSWAEFRLRKM